MMTVQQAFDLALQHHQAGRLAEAEGLYRQILAVQPDHAQALHLLGVIALQMGQHEAAENLLRRSIAMAPDNPAAHYDLGNALRSRKRLEDAIAAYRRAIELRPDYVEALHNLGVACKESGRLDEAIAAFQGALRLQPQLMVAHYNLGNALRERKRYGEAIAAYRQAIALGPDYVDAHNNLGVACKEAGRFEEAVAAYQRAIELQPDHAAAHNNLGAAWRERGALDEAIVAQRRAIELRPDFAEAYNNLGVACKERGRTDEAVAAFRRSIELQPDFAETHNNLGNTLQECGRADEAIAAYRRALALQPEYAAAANNLASTLRSVGLLDEATAAIRRALELQPALSDIRNNLGNILKDQGDVEGAIGAYREALQLEPVHPATWQNLIYSLLYQPGGDETTIVREQERWSATLCAPFRPARPSYPNARDPERKLRVGYVSPEYRDHVTGRNLIPLFRCHDHQQFDFVYYSGVFREDWLTGEFRQAADAWTSTVGVSDEALATMIRKDEVDILVDLTQHMGGNRLGAFARRPAPVQVSFAGYPASAGLETIGYRLSDRWVEGEGEKMADGKWQRARGGTERVFLLDSFWCYDPCGVEVPVNALPARESGRLTFGCLNNFCKVNEPLLRLWARVLVAVKDARLVLSSPRGSHRQRTLDFLERAGVAPRRVEFVEPCPRRAYLELYHQLDVVLDTFPYNGHTTSLDALWMGVPVVSLAGKPAVSRAGLSQLSNLGLPELVAHSEDEYVAVAARLAGASPRLAELRSTLRTRMEGSVLMDGAHLARQMEEAYRAMWQLWCAENSLSR
ncbi:tetratricopeptide repeat protein [Chthoniobacter flavus]|nr:tetratricopeptide repeat protein [Chthoniobacter flavus]